MFSDFKHNISRKELNDRFPIAHWFDNVLFKDKRWEYPKKGCQGCCSHGTYGRGSHCQPTATTAAATTVAAATASSTARTTDSAATTANAAATTATATAAATTTAAATAAASTTSTTIDCYVDPSKG